MGTQIWCLIASILMVSVESELHEHISQSFYETPQYSSPKPIPLPSPLPEIPGMKEVVLFLTPEQVHKLQAAGAVVRPFPELLSGFSELQEKFKQSMKHQNISDHQIVALNNDNKLDLELENYYKLLNIQEINDDLAQQPNTTTIKTPTTPRYKYNKSRYQHKDKDYYTSYMAKKANRTKISNQNSNTEYVRFLPNYEKENLKMVPYNALPLFPYRSGEYIFVQSYRPRSNVYAPPVKLSERNTTLKPAEQDLSWSSTPLPVVPPVQETSKEQVAKSEIHVEISTPSVSYKPTPPRTGSKPMEIKETLASIKGLPAFKDKSRIVKPIIPAPVTEPDLDPKEDQLSLLLAPLYQHQTISETISQQKGQLFNDELKIQSKLQPLKDPPQRDDEQFATEIEKIISNLRKQNALAKIEATSKSPSVSISHDAKKSRPIEILNYREVSIPTSVLVRSQPLQVPSPYPLHYKITRTMPILEQETRKVEVKSGGPVGIEQRVPVPIKLEKPHLMPKVVPVSMKHDMRETVPIYMPEKLTIIRHIWEH